MKLRIGGNSLRLRLTRTEIAELAACGFVENRVQLGPECALVYRLGLSGTVAKPEIAFREGRICVWLPLAEAMAWTRGEKVGIYNEEAEGVKLAIEKDFKCLDPRLDEDESDVFENPNGVSRACASN